MQYVQAELAFPCFAGTVGSIVGPKWSYVTSLCEMFSNSFPGSNMSVTYDGNQFLVHLPYDPEAAAFVYSTLGQRIQIAEEGIVAEPAGAIIGKGGWWLRKTEAECNVPCTIYHDNGKFYVKFPWNASNASRVEAMDNIRRKIIGRSLFMEETFSDAETMSTVSAHSLTD